MPCLGFRSVLGGLYGARTCARVRFSYAPTHVRRSGWNDGHRRPPCLGRRSLRMRKNGSKRGLFHKCPQCMVMVIGECLAVREAPMTTRPGHRTHAASFARTNEIAAQVVSRFVFVFMHVFSLGGPFCRPSFWSANSNAPVHHISQLLLSPVPLRSDGGQGASPRDKTVRRCSTSRNEGFKVRKAWLSIRAVFYRISCFSWSVSLG